MLFHPVYNTRTFHRKWYQPRYRLTGRDFKVLVSCQSGAWNYVQRRAWPGLNSIPCLLPGDLSLNSCTSPLLHKSPQQALLNSGQDIGWPSHSTWRTGVHFKTHLGSCMSLAQILAALSCLCPVQMGLELAEGQGGHTTPQTLYTLAPQSEVLQGSELPSQSPAPYLWPTVVFPLASFTTPSTVVASHTSVLSSQLSCPCGFAKCRAPTFKDMQKLEKQLSS